MKPGLQAFFDSMEEYFAQPGAEALERLYGRHPGWDAPRPRMALYGHFVRHHGHSSLEKLYPLVRGSVGEDIWAALARDYLAAGPARPFELNRVGEGFPAFLGDEARRRGLPDFLPALARFEWTDFAVYASQEPLPGRVERLEVNPTLTVLEHPFQLCPFLAAGARGEPAPGEERVLLWRHPVRLVTMYQSADDGSLLGVKMALEGLTPAQVAAATGVAEAGIQATLDACVAGGLVLSP